MYNTNIDLAIQLNDCKVGGTMTVNYKPKTKMITITGNLARHSEIEVYNKERGDMVIRANTLSTKTRVSFCFKAPDDFPWYLFDEDRINTKYIITPEVLLNHETVQWIDEHGDKIYARSFVGLNSFIKISRASKIYLDETQSLTVIVSSKDDLQFFASTKNTRQRLNLKKQQDRRIIILR